MQIKNFFLDLREWPQYAKQQNNVWLLESEAFKEPLQFTFEFDSKDKQELEKAKEECQRWFTLIQEKEKQRSKILEWLQVKEEMITKCYQDIEWLIEREKELRKDVDRRSKDGKDVLKEFADTILEQNNKLAKIQEVIAEPKPSKIYHYTQSLLVTWDDIHYGESIELPSWKYAIIEKKEFIPQNEYVLLEKDNPIDFKIQFVDKEYIPEVKIRSSNGVNKPVCKVEIDVLFFQI